MLTRWYTMTRNTVLSHTTTDDNRSCLGDPVVLSAEPEQADVGEAQHSEKMYPNSHADHVPQHSCAGPGDERNDSSWSESTLCAFSHGVPEVEKGPSHESATDNRTDCNPAAPVWGDKEKISDDTSPQDHSTYDDAKLVYLGQRPKNVILFGETGVGKSSVINLVAGREIAKTSGNLEGCTLQSTEYWFGLSEEVSLRIFDTVGLEEPEIGVNSFMGAMEKAHQLVKSLHHSGGIDLLLFCVRGGRITTAMQRSYRLFHEVLCGSQVPLAIVVTNLEQENVMEDWWAKNEKTFEQYGIRTVAHACITAVPARVTMYAQKRAESQKALRKMLLETLTKPNPSYVRDIRGWFTAIVQLLRSYLVKTESLRKRDLMRKLEKRCMLPRNDAEKLAQMIAAGEMIDAALV